jgi:hemin uptake protein HemP
VTDQFDNSSDPDSRSAEPASPGPRMISVTGHRIDSRDLFIGTREVIIQHSGEIYRLRLTAHNKLILTK